MTNEKHTIALFPGQGSQKVGMGREFFENSEIGKARFSAADKALGFSLSKICLEGPLEELTLTHIAQPAILTVSTICYEILMEKTEGTFSPAAAAGHSLGEYSALVAAGALTFEDAVQLVNKRGRYMQEAVPAGAGTMLAILGKEVSEVEAAVTKVTSGVAEIANINAPGQIVVAGDVAAINELRDHLPGTKFIELTVSAPFHCRLMAPARDNLKKDLAAVNFKPAAFPVVANFSAAPVSKPDEIREQLTLQVCGRVRWVESMQYLARTFSPLTAVEFGAGAVLTGMLRRIEPAAARLNADSLESIGAIAAGVRG